MVLGTADITPLTLGKHRLGTQANWVSGTQPEHRAGPRAGQGDFLSQRQQKETCHKCCPQKRKTQDSPLTKLLINQEYQLERKRVTMGVPAFPTSQCLSHVNQGLATHGGGGYTELRPLELLDRWHSLQAPPPHTLSPMMANSSSTFFIGRRLDTALQVRPLHMSFALDKG